LTSTNRILLLGHRGARLYAPENTLGAFDLALEHGADGFEFDIRSTRNSRSVICHDPKMNHLSVRRHTFEQLCDSYGVQELRPACLEDIIARYASTAFLNLEIKVRGLEQEVIATVRRMHMREGYFVSSFLPGVIRKLHAMDDSLVLGTISKTRWQLRRWSWMPARYVVPHYHLLSRRLVEEVHAAGKLVITWTVNEPENMLRAADMGVDGIISDDTKTLVRTLKI
jgi:glycerophosphoryl diester phosphodiesterase